MSAIEQLHQAALDALQFCRAEFSGFKVGVAVETRSGRIYKGSNIENPSLMMSICAEKVAVLKALTEEDSPIKSILIVSSDGQYTPPCGSCRQFILEFAPEVDIYLASEKGIKKYSINELLPYAFKRP